jgi:hypothetical protein
VFVFPISATRQTRKREAVLAADHTAPPKSGVVVVVVVVLMCWGKRWEGGKEGSYVPCLLHELSLSEGVRELTSRSSLRRLPMVQVPK